MISHYLRYCIKLHLWYPPHFHYQTFRLSVSKQQTTLCENNQATRKIRTQMIQMLELVKFKLCQKLWEHNLEQQPDKQIMLPVTFSVHSYQRHPHRHLWEATEIKAPHFSVSHRFQAAQNLAWPSMMWSLRDPSMHTYRILESFWLEKTFRIIESNHYQSPPSFILYHVTQHHISTHLKHSPFSHFHGEPVLLFWEHYQWTNSSSCPT